MRCTVWGVVGCVVLAAACGGNVAHAQQPIPIKALARQPALQQVTMTPDGKYLVGLIPSPKDAQETAIAVWDTNALTAGPMVVQPSGKEGRMQFTSVAALKAGKILALARQEWTGQLSGCGEGKMVGSTRTFATTVYLTGVHLKKFDEAFASKRRHITSSNFLRECLKLTGTASLVNSLPQDPDEVIIRRISVFNPVGSYYLFNLKTEKATLLFKGRPGSSPTVFDAKTGKVLVRTRIEPQHDGSFIQKTLILDPKTGQLEPQKALENDLSSRHTVDVVARDGDTDKYFVLTDQFSDQVQARLYDAATHKYLPNPVAANANYSITGLVFGDQPVNMNKVVGVEVGGPYIQTIYVAPNLKAIQAALEKQFPDQQVDITGYTNDFTKVLFTTVSASQPRAFHLLVGGKQVLNLGSERPWIKPGETGAESWVTYTARDGMTIPAILDLPAGWKKGDAPGKAVVLPHGGPWDRDYMGWSPTGWIPLLTSRGYAVLRPEFRGSQGLGRKLWLAGDKEWGLKMSDDLDDGAAWLVKQGIAKKNAIAIFGYSYGGFAAVAADVRSPSPYQCAIAGAPVTNLARLDVTFTDKPLARLLAGTAYKGMNPMDHTSQAHLPIMLYAGDRDVRVPEKPNAKAFYDAVKSIVPAKFHLIPDMPHSLPWYPRQKRATMQYIVNFLAHDCGGVSQVQGS